MTERHGRNTEGTPAGAPVPGSRVNHVAIVKLKIDVSGTLGLEVWHNLRQFAEIQSARFGPRFGSSGDCKHPSDSPHPKGEWVGAEIRLATPLLAQYAVSHYLEQDRVLDADVAEI